MRHGQWATFDHEAVGVDPAHDGQLVIGARVGHVRHTRILAEIRKQGVRAVVTRPPSRGTTEPPPEADAGAARSTPWQPAAVEGGIGTS